MWPSGIGADLEWNRFWLHFLTVSDILHYTTSHHSHHITSYHIPSHHITSHHITSHHITSHHITSHHITSYYITLHHITSHYITLHHITSHYITLHHITSHYITLHHITSHYITLHHITSHYIPLHHITSHYITLHHITSHYITLHHITSHYIIYIYIYLYCSHPGLVSGSETATQSGQDRINLVRLETSSAENSARKVIHPGMWRPSQSGQLCQESRRPARQPAWHEVSYKQYRVGWLLSSSTAAADPESRPSSNASISLDLVEDWLL